jgi:hypothetical protein
MAARGPANPLVGAPGSWVRPQGRMLWKLFDSIGIVGAAPKERKRIIKPSGNTIVSYSFSTFTLTFFTGLHQKWYVQIEGKTVKILPANIGELLTPRAIAYWLCGDLI